MANFAYNPNGTISLHYDNLTPSDVRELITLLEGNLFIMENRKENPISVLKSSAKLNRVQSEISFKLSWAGPLITIPFDERNEDREIPKPIQKLSDEDLVQYYNILGSMLAAL